MNADISIKKKQISEFTTVITGGTPSTKNKRYWDGDIPWLNSGVLNDGDVNKPSKLITKEGLNNSAAKLMPVDTILIALTGTTTGQVGHLRFEACANQSVTGIIPSEEHHPRYLFYFFQTQREKIKGDAFGGAQPHINQKYVKDFYVPLPPLEEQKRIAVILDAVHALLSKRRESLAQLDTFLQSIFLDMFGDPVTNPKKWEQCILGDVVHSAKDGPHVSPQYSDNGIPFLSARHIKPGELVWEDLKYIDQNEADKQWKKCKPEFDDILYTKGGTTGIAACVKTSEPFAIWVHVALLKPVIEKVSPVWLERMLNSAYCYTQSQRYTHGIANRDLGLKRMIKIKIFLPPLDLQRSFATIVESVEKYKTQQQKHLTELKNLFASLQQRAFKGEL